MNLSYWEYKTWLSNVDFTIVGSGIVGLSCALALRDKFPAARILVLERGILPRGASTKNAGFACYGSISEILSDLSRHSEEEVRELVRMRWEGIAELRKILGDKAMRFEQFGGHELFLKSDRNKYERCLAELDRINELLEPVFKATPFKLFPNTFAFDGIVEHYISNPLEAQLDTGKMMSSLLTKAQSSGISIMNSVSVTAYEQLNDQVVVQTEHFEFNSNKLFIATNGFASQFFKDDVQPARAQVLITKPVPELHVKGTFHMDEGYYYFRNVDDRILLGGARNLEIEAETTEEFGLTDRIQSRLESVLAEVILPGRSFEIERRWSGIMGIGLQKKPILKSLSQDVYCGVRLGGMGIAIGTSIGRSLAEFLD